MKTGRNTPCHCGSGMKYKRCCYEKDRKSNRHARKKQSNKAQHVVFNLKDFSWTAEEIDLEDGLPEVFQDENAYVSEEWKKLLKQKR